MGFAAPQAVNQAGRRNYSAVVFDRASGGAGFSSVIAQDPVGALKEAQTLLDCGEAGRCGDPEAIQACPRCVLSADSQHSADETDRKTAFDLLQRITPRLEVAAEAKLFGEPTVYEAAPLAGALSNLMSLDGAADLLVAMPGDPAEWELEVWPLAPVLQRWGARGRALMLLVDKERLFCSDAVTRKRFTLWAQHARVQLRDTPSPPPWLAAVRSGSSATGWASASPDAARITATWGAASAAPVVRGPTGTPVVGSEITASDLLTVSGSEALVDIGSECDGTVTGFGARLKAVLSARSPSLATVFSEPFVSFDYSDRYLFNPLTARLVAELVAAFCDRDSEVIIRTLAARRDRGQPREGSLLHDDWTDLVTRTRVLEQLLTEIAPAARVLPSQATAHRRRLDFRTGTRSGSIFLDQGVGFLASPGAHLVRSSSECGGTDRCGQAAVLHREQSGWHRRRGAARSGLTCGAGSSAANHKRNSLPEVAARPRLIPHHLVVGEHLLDGRAGGQRLEFAGCTGQEPPAVADNRRTGRAVRTLRRASGVGDIALLAALFSLGK